MENFTWSRGRQAAEVFSALPDAVAALVYSKLQAPGLGARLVAGPPDARQLRQVLRAFALELSERSGAQLPDLGRRSLIQMCRFHPDQAAAVLKSWLEPAAPNGSELLGRLAQVDWSPCHLDGRTAGAALLMLTDPAEGSQLFKHMKPDEVHSLTLSLGTLPAMDSDFRAQVLGLFEHRCGCWLELVQSRPEAAAACLNWLAQSVEPWEKHLHFDWTKIRLSGPSIAAILLDGLQPEWKDDFVRSLDARSADHLRAASRMLLPAQESLQQQLTQDFFRHFGESARQPEVMRRCLERVANQPPARPLSQHARSWKGLLVLYGDLLEKFLADPASLEVLSLHRAQLENAWGRMPRDYLLLVRPELGPYEVVVRDGEEELDRFELYPGRSLVWRADQSFWVEEDSPEPCEHRETYLQVLTRKLWSLQARLAKNFEVLGSRGSGLPPELLAGVAALRAFPADYLTQHLMELDPEGLQQVATSVPELFALTPEQLNERLLDSCQLSPLELMQQAGLWPPDSSACPPRVSTVAVLLTLAPQAGPIAGQLVKTLGRRLSQQLTERMMRLFYRWQDRRLEPSE